ncbi:MAG TPA: ABC transporter ATP-binding protein [Bacilli bacterium]|nr:MAG: ABC-type transporter ATP-binding protein EcsA [Tenericutes bacterium ADurb.BinA124]HNZ50441.1 ABC transporter ATP-binding protein [Bacilli bacterium]HOH18434.1 ABC transporter ATP-binding protein [Bacilli bacterium]HPX84420.1 ABC transporter ATP-binding protein [Bacilli bacterium]HQC74737.1 ABC transporter ATP-binding protein [Bacilli bacterium]
MLEIKNLSKTYPGGKLAVDDVSLTINDGEIFGFIGHNGAGKTTTLKCAVGILDFEKGDILLDGKSIKKQAIECKQEIAYIPDNPDLYEQLTGIQYLNFICDIYRVSTADRNVLISQYADMFEIKKNLGDLISSYSHGMKQKLALISALVRKPKLFVLDEPFVGLDPKAAFQVKELMKELCANGSCVFFSTHVLEVAEKLCHRVAIIQKGKIVAYGTMEEVKGDKSLEDVFLELVNNA